MSKRLRKKIAGNNPYFIDIMVFVRYIESDDMFNL